MIIRIEYGLKSDKKYYLYFNPEKEFFTISPTKIIFTQDEISGTESLEIGDIIEMDAFLIKNPGDNSFFTEFYEFIHSKGGLK